MRATAGRLAFRVIPATLLNSRAHRRSVLYHIRLVAVSASQRDNSADQPEQ
jgi:hypothetical protein